MNKSEVKPKMRDAEGDAPTGAPEKQKTSIEEQVKREFKYSADHGEPEQEQIQSELAEQDYMLPSPMNSREDVAFTNINPDQMGMAVGVANQRNEPLDILEKVEDRDEDRWALNPASAESED
ncbi:MAG: DUF6335 family protein [bacterium]|nr:DUF6335 family protein [bacterium]